MQAIRRSGTLATKPDNLLGNGIPHFERASQIINPILGTEPKTTHAVKIYPNPVSIGQAIHIEHDQVLPMTLEIISAQGAVIQTLTNITSISEISLPPFVSGKYYFRFTSDSGSQTIPVLLNL